MRTISLFPIFLVCGSFFVAPAFAQKAVDPTLYSAIKERLAAEDYLQGRDPTTLTQEQIQAMLTQAVVTSRIRQVGDIVATGSAAAATTGLTGIATGMLPRGLYEVSMSAIRDIALTIPKEFLVHSEADNILAIGMQEKKGKGSVTYIAQSTRPSPGLWQASNNLLKQVLANVQTSIINVVARIFPSVRSPQQQLAQKIAQQEVAGANVTRLPVRVRLYQDTNGNRKFDEGEKIVPWAQVRVELKKISNERPLSLTSGTNTVRFDPLPANMASAYDFLAETAASGVREATIATVDGSAPVSVTTKGGELFGTNFPLAPDTNYTVIVTSPVTLMQILR